MITYAETSLPKAALQAARVNLVAAVFNGKHGGA
jgi:hypothetical protein